MTTLSLTGADPVTVSADALVVGVARGRGGKLVLAPGARSVDEALGGQLAATLTALGATGREDTATRLTTFGALSARVVIAVGLGEVPVRERFPAARLRRAAGVGARLATGLRRLAVALPLANDPVTALDVEAVAEGVLLGAYQFTRFHGAGTPSGDPDRPSIASAVLAVTDPRDSAARAALRRAEVLADAVRGCRDLVNTPAADLHPADLADAAAALGGPLGLEVDVLDEEQLAAGGYGGILGVGQGAAHPPRLIRLGYRPGGADRTVALVGKGITFDSGGLSLKPADAMVAMKSDMSGAAAVITTLTAIARLELPVNVTGWVPTAENMPGGRAIRPSDVLRMYGGTTVEVTNTDAEGRLVLADAIVRAGEERPDVLIDVATLTGAQVVALGSRVFAVMSNNDDLRAAVVSAAGHAGEEAWPMPLPEHLRRTLESTVADLKNTGNREGGMLVGGLFLREFVPAGLPWAHLDIAGPSFNTADPYGYTPRGGTGVAVRTLTEFVAGYAGV